MVHTNSFLAIAVTAALVAAEANAAELQRATPDAWQVYVRGAGTRVQARIEGSQPYLWIDEMADRARRVKRGEIVVAPLVTGAAESVPDGLNHHWIGALSIPNVTIASLLNVVHDYDGYKDIYKPVVTESHWLQPGATENEFSMVWQKHILFFNAAMRGRYRAHEVTIDSYRRYSIVEATTVQQIDEYGRPGEHLLPPETESGFIWRIYNVVRYEQRDGGVFLKIKSIALSRDVPISMRWLVSPVVNHLSVNSLTTTLRQTREAVDRRRVAQERCAVKEHQKLN